MLGRHAAPRNISQRAGGDTQAARRVVAAAASRAISACGTRPIIPGSTSRRALPGRPASPRATSGEVEPGLRQRLAVLVGGGSRSGRTGRFRSPSAPASNGLPGTKRTLRTGFAASLPMSQLQRRPAGRRAHASRTGRFPCTKPVPCRKPVQHCQSDWRRGHDTTASSIRIVRGPCRFQARRISHPVLADQAIDVRSEAGWEKYVRYASLLKRTSDPMTLLVPDAATDLLNFGRPSQRNLMEISSVTASLRRARLEGIGYALQSYEHDPGHRRRRLHRRLFRPPVDRRRAS